jgi:hypothetical protein
MINQMVKLIIPLSIAVMTVTSAAPAIAQDNFVLNKFPKTYVKDGTTYSNLEGYVLNVPDYAKLVIRNPDLTDEVVRCDAIHPSLKTNGGASRRTQCTGGSAFNCYGLYYNTPQQPSSYDINRMIPNQPVAYWVNKMKIAEPSKNFVGVNLGFFNLQPLAGRSTDDSQWKPIYQETCGRTLGTYKRAGTTTSWYSDYNDVEKLSSGGNDQYFGSLIFTNATAADDTYLSYSKLTSTNIKPLISSSEVVVPGVWVRYNGSNIGATDSGVPQFVEAKWSSKVGRTAIGFNPDNRQMRIIVIQPGQGTSKQDCYYVADVITCVPYEPNAGRGVTVDEVRNLIGTGSAYPYVLLLDGSGSSQLASTKDYVADSNATKGRTDCLWSLATCTSRGDSVTSSFVSHLAAGYRTRKNPQDSTKTLVDRPNPTVLLLEY